MACIYDYSAVLANLHAKLSAVDSLRGIARAKINAEVFPSEQERSERPSTWAFLEYMRSKNRVVPGNLRTTLLADIATIREAVNKNERCIRSMVDEAFFDACEVSAYCGKLEDKVDLVEKEYARAIGELEQKQTETKKPCVADAIGRAKGEVEFKLVKIQAVKNFVAGTVKTRVALSNLHIVKQRAYKKPKAYFTSKKDRDAKLRWLAARAAARAM